MYIDDKQEEKKKKKKSDFLGRNKHPKLEKFQRILNCAFPFQVSFLILQLGVFLDNRGDGSRNRDEGELYLTPAAPGYEHIAAGAAEVKL